MSKLDNTTDAPSVTPRGRPRRKVTSPWKSRWIKPAAVATMVALAGGGAWWGWSSGAIVRTAEAVKWRVISATVDVGFRVKEILVAGRKETTRADLLEAVRLARGAPILAFDLSDARERVESLSWIRNATVERLLPDTVLVTVDERRPMALWQHKGKFALIDEQGEIILQRGLERFSDLLVVVGDGAPEGAAELLRILGTQPDLMRRVEAAVWVSGRRWNIRLKGDIDVRLPEQDVTSAWTRLAEYQKAHQVLERDVQILDLRIPDRLIVRKAPKKQTPGKAGGQQT